MRRPLIAANWKMHLGRAEEALALVRRLRPALSALDSVDVAICPPFTVLASLAEVLRNSPIGLGAQTMHWAESGAHTGDVSPAMLAGLCDYAILGHSERRASAGPGASDEAINRKVLAAVEHGLTPIVCVGESAAQREAGETHGFVSRQVAAALQGVDPAAARRIVLAYEPIWAIGSGRAATPAEANRTIGITVRGAVADSLGEGAAELTRILYGGSVDADNITDFMHMPDIDGALVGGASLSPDFADLAKAAAAACDPNR
ncbi:MAG: triose-phosphate isomerase [Gemmatimonadetes bacterium]|nr:triose-phosphate isomerase [Gemmatimonadota bacterium]NNK48310.1 triose-phosphate isomerase [Gemmatimonadota bacterium]